MNVITMLDLKYGTVPGAPRLCGKTFFGLHLYSAGRCCKNPQSARAPRNLNPARAAITKLVGVAIYCTIFNKSSPPPRQFLGDKILFEKKN